jgi:hypothetical protein
VKLPPDVPVIRSISDSAECGPAGPATIVRRNSSSTPKEKAAARVPPPENVRMSSVCGSLSGNTVAGLQ